ncbi:MAG: sulfurtransferase-like selenium metabolism protein YedF [Tissierellaceae bacterium]
MKIEVDARKEACPRPVIMTKKELDGMENGLVTTIVDNEVAKDNVSKLAISLGYSFIIDKGRDSEYYIHITKGNVSEIKADEADLADEGPAVCIPDTFKDLTIAFGSNKMGGGEEELGKILMKSLIYTIGAATPFPSTMVFYNSGVYLTCEGSEVLEDLKELEEEGVEIISCGACLDYYHLQEKIQVGEIGNMYLIYEKMKNANNTITFG